MSAAERNAAEPTINAVAPWFGANRMGAAAVGEELRGCDWVGVVFAGSMAEIPFLECGAIVVNDRHRHIVNLARVIASDELYRRLLAELDAQPFHPDILTACQAYCRHIELLTEAALADQSESIVWAVAYFVSAWMNRSACAGTKSEFSGSLPIRWSATGGDSNVRYRSAVASIAAWHEQMKRCNFSTLDFREFLAKCQDEEGRGIYADPPFPGPGDNYAITMTEADHRFMAAKLRSFKKARVVCRFYDHPLVRELYPKDFWTWRELNGRDQHNAKDKLEVLILNGPSRAQQKGLF